MADGGEDLQSALVAATSQALLFFLLAGMAGSVDVHKLRVALRRWQGLGVGLSCQFLLLPLLGFCSAKAYRLPPKFGIALIATTSSPGGAYSNWWCSVMNADLALSIAMTTCSTAVSVIFMPLNMLVYTHLAYGAVPNLSWPKLLASIAVAVTAIMTGTAASACWPKKRRWFNAFGNISGIALIIFGMVVSSVDEPVWDKDLVFYPAVALPCILGMTAACVVAFCSPLTKPEVVAVVVETTYQNTGLALSVALASFGPKDRGSAAGVPLFYAVVQLVVLPLFLFIAWKLGYTHAPRQEPFCNMVMGDYQPVELPCVDGDARVAPAPKGDASSSLHAATLGHNEISIPRVETTPAASELEELEQVQESQQIGN